MDGLADRHMDGLLDRQTDRQTDMDDGRMDELTDGWTRGLMSRRLDSPTDWQMDELKD